MAHSVVLKLEWILRTDDYSPQFLPNLRKAPFGVRSFAPQLQAPRECRLPLEAIPLFFRDHLTQESRELSLGLQAKVEVCVTRMVCPMRVDSVDGMGTRSWCHHPHCQQHSTPSPSRHAVLFGSLGNQWRLASAASNDADIRPGYKSLTTRWERLCHYRPMDIRPRSSEVVVAGAPLLRSALMNTIATSAAICAT